MPLNLYVSGAYHIAKLLRDIINTVALTFSDNTKQRYKFIAKEIIDSETEDAIILKIGTIVNVDTEKNIIRIDYERWRPEDDVYELILWKETSIVLSPGLNIIEHEIKIRYAL
jgi:hypothetical protein